MKSKLSPLVSNGEVDEIISACRNAGALGAKLCGAGHSGYIFVLTDGTFKVEMKLRELFSGNITNIHVNLMSLGLLLVKEEKLNGIFSFFNKVVNLFVSFTILIVVQVIFPDELKAQYFILFFVLGMAFSAELGITSYTSIKIANALNGVSYTKVSNVHKFRFDL